MIGTNDKHDSMLFEITNMTGTYHFNYLVTAHTLIGVGLQVLNTFETKPSLDSIYSSGNILNYTKL